MRLAFLLPNYSGHVVGSTLVYYNYALQMARKGHSVDVYHPSRDREIGGISARAHGAMWALKKLFVRKPVPWQDFPAGVTPRFRETFRGMSLDHDIVLAFSWRGLEWLQDMDIRGRIFGYIVEYETWAEAQGERRDRMESAYRSGHPLLSSSVVVRDMLQELGLPDVRLCVHGIDRSIYRTTTPVEDRAPAMVGCPVRSESVKSPEVLRETLSLLRARHGSGIHLWGFGGPRPPEGIVDLLDDYRAHPSHEELAALHNRSSIFFVPSRKEGFGMPAAEAMSCGSALVSTDNGGVRTFAEHDRDCLLVSPDDPVALADGVTRLVEDQELRMRLARQATISTEFLDWELAGERLAREIGA
jgi:glycosyltransferase involved in cell wall biosynthesis